MMSTILGSFFHEVIVNDVGSSGIRDSDGGIGYCVVKVTEVNKPNPIGARLESSSQNLIQACA
jgi:hypothetical protein